MNEQISFDEDAAHRHFAASCFNKAWELIEKEDRTREDELELVRLTHASHWHWTQFRSHTVTNLSVGYWQTSRVYAVLGDAEEALRYAELCEEISRDADVSSFYLAYAYEALARAASVAGNAEATSKFREEAIRLSESLADDERTQLLDDLGSILE